MAVQLVSVEDYVNISNTMATYMWLVDAGDDAAWGELFTEDAMFTGVPPGPRHGREAIKEIARLTGLYGGKYRHLSGNYSIAYGDTSDEAWFRYYALTTTWLKDSGPQFDNMALAKANLVRIDGVWKIRSNEIELLKE